MDSTLPHLKDSRERLLDGPCFPLGSPADFVSGQRILSLKAAFPFREFACLLRRSGDGTATDYASITILACVGYSALFLVVGLFFRNPIIPAIVLYLWEWANFLMPSILKKSSVIHYLNSLAPVPVYEGPFALPALPTPAWIAVPSLIAITALVLLLASRRIRHMKFSTATNSSYRFQIGQSYRTTDHRQGRSL